MQTLILILLAVLVIVSSCNLYFTYMISAAFKEEHRQNEFLWGSYDALKHGIFELNKFLKKGQKSDKKRGKSAK